MFFGSVGMHTGLPETVVVPWTDVTNLATGIMIIVAQARGSDVVGISLPHLSASVSLNVLLTLMIVIRLVMHRRNVRAATGSSAGISGLYKAVATILIDSSALYAVTSLVLIGLWAARSGAAEIFTPIHAEIQVCASTRLESPDRLSYDDWIGDRSTAHG